MAWSSRETRPPCAATRCGSRGKTFVCIIHNLAKLDYFDTVTVIHKGCVVFSGTPKEMMAHFEIDTPLSLYDRLNEFDLPHWLGLCGGGEGGQKEQRGKDGGAAGIFCFSGIPRISC